MGIKIEWPVLLRQCPQLLTVLPVDTIWPDARFPRMDIVLSDQTASVQHMNFTGCASVYTSGEEFRRRLLNKFTRENLSYHPHTLVLLWDKPWTTPRRAEMYKEKRYAVPAETAAVPAGKIRGCDGRFYHPTMAPLPRFDERTGFGLKAEMAITEEKMYPLPQLLAASWTKVLLAQFICHSLWDFALGRAEHFIFDTPMVEGDELCDGTMKCNRGPLCSECPGAKIPRHGEGDVLFLFHIRRLFGMGALADGGSFLVRGTNDRDLLAVLAFPFDAGLAEKVWWCKGTNNYGMSARGTWEKPSELTGEPVSCHEYISMGRMTAMLGGLVGSGTVACGKAEGTTERNGASELLLTRLMLLFFFGGDYCECPNGLTAGALNVAFFDQQTPIVSQLNATTIAVDLTELHYFIQNASSRSSRCKTKLGAANLLKCTLDAIYSLCYYTGFHGVTFETGVAIGPMLAEFGYTGPGQTFEADEELLDAMKPLLLPVLAGGTGARPFLVHQWGEGV